MVENSNRVVEELGNASGHGALLALLAAVPGSPSWQSLPQDDEGSKQPHPDSAKGRWRARSLGRGASSWPMMPASPPP
ncbi:uncharacterized protein VTP21DRAFT_5604 [Calcarisporiella thermophila]|uniref:uncharacterized protein n=1 Tax=Calcarisporiella thermophila TaxID=911321 RepID=UPI0037426C1A